MEEAVVLIRRQTVVEHNSPHKLQAQGENCHFTEELRHIPDIRNVVEFFSDHGVIEREPPCGRKRETGRDHHDPQTSNLDEPHHDKLTRQRQNFRDIDGDKSRHGQRRYGIDELKLLPRLDGHREHQQQRRTDNKQDVGQHQTASRSEVDISKTPQNPPDGEQPRHREEQKSGINIVIVMLAAFHAPASFPTQGPA